ncbi:DUF3068 domain-containing protein [Corynebacterium mayonis]|uniref:DUF3068 domain-containing protein n=1 Tax=Corynebacterium mayonis TaxID=3062461 RepID=UPI003140960B
MLSASRIFSVLLTGLGIALIAGGVVAPRFLLGDARLPLDLEHTTWTLTDDNGTYRGESVPVTRQLHMQIQNPADEDSVGIRIGDSLRAGAAERDFDNLVAASTWSYEMDRGTGLPVSAMRVSAVMATPDAVVQKGGVWLKFPADVAQETYDVFEPHLRETVPATFVGEDEVEGRRVYRFEQHVAPTNVALKYADVRNTKTILGPEGEQIRSFYYHSAHRELTVDQISGLVVGVKERVDDFYGDVAGQRLEEIIRYDAGMEQGDVEKLAGQLGAVYSQGQSRSVTIAVIALGAVLALIGVIGALRSGNKRRSRGRHAA